MLVVDYCCCCCCFPRAHVCLYPHTRAFYFCAHAFTFTHFAVTPLPFYFARALYTPFTRLRSVYPALYVAHTFCDFPTPQVRSTACLYPRFIVFAPPHTCLPVHRSHLPTRPATPRPRGTRIYLCRLAPAAPPCYPTPYPAHHTFAFTFIYLPPAFAFAVPFAFAFALPLPDHPLPRAYRSVCLLYARFAFTRFARARTALPRALPAAPRTAARHNGARAVAARRRAPHARAFCTFCLLPFARIYPGLPRRSTRFAGFAFAHTAHAFYRTHAFCARTHFTAHTRLWPLPHTRPHLYAPFVPRPPPRSGSLPAALPAAAFPARLCAPLPAHLPALPRLPPPPPGSGSGSHAPRTRAFTPRSLYPTPHLVPPRDPTPGSAARLLPHTRTHVPDLPYPSLPQVPPPQFVPQLEFVPQVPHLFVLPSSPPAHPLFVRCWIRSTPAQFVRSYAYLYLTLPSGCGCVHSPPYLYRFCPTGSFPSSTLPHLTQFGFVHSPYPVLPRFVQFPAFAPCPRWLVGSFPSCCCCCWSMTSWCQLVRCSVVPLCYACRAVGWLDGWLVQLVVELSSQVGFGPCPSCWLPFALVRSSVPVAGCFCPRPVLLLVPSCC